MTVISAPPTTPVGYTSSFGEDYGKVDPYVPQGYTAGPVDGSSFTVQGSSAEYPNFAGSLDMAYLGNQYRGLGSSWLNAQDIARENYVRDQVAKDLDLYRSLYSQRENNQFNADQSALQRAHELYMSNTQYTRALQDLKNAGINPNLILGGSSGASASSSSAARSGSSSYGSSGYMQASQDSLAETVGSVLRLVGNILQIKAGKIPKT